jgi:hypothetical protein
MQRRAPADGIDAIHRNEKDFFLVFYLTLHKRWRTAQNVKGFPQMQILQKAAIHAADLFHLYRCLDRR